MKFKQICLKLSEKMWPNKCMKQFAKHRKIAYVMKLHCTNTEHTFVVIRVCDLHTKLISIVDESPSTSKQMTWAPQHFETHLIE